MKMERTQVQDYARQLFDAHGAMAAAEAAQKARLCEERNLAEQADDWRQIEAAIKSMRGAHQG